MRTALDPLETLHRRLGDLVPGAFTPGAVVLISHRGTVIFYRAYGWAQTHDEDGPLDEPRPMTTDTIFDIASITKLFTTAAIMRLEADGEVTLDTPARTFLPALEPGPACLTVDQLLTHRGGLATWQPVYLYAEHRDDALEWVCRHGVRYRPDRRRYSDLGFVLLGGIVEQVTGERLDRFCEQVIFTPLGMATTRFRPPPAIRRRTAATSTGNRTEQRMIETDDPEPVDGSAGDFRHWRTHTFLGEVQDGNAAHAFGGVAGSAGAFSTASDLATFGDALRQALSGGAGIWDGSRLGRFLREPYDRGQGRGWWTRRCDWAGKRVGFGHGGFTGCEIAVVPEVDAVAVLLTNRLHTERDPPPDHTGLWRLVLDGLRASVAPAR